MPIQHLGTMGNKEDYLSAAIGQAGQNFAQQYRMSQDWERQRKLDEAKTVSAALNYYQKSGKETRQMMDANPKWQELLSKGRELPEYAGLIAEDENGGLKFIAQSSSTPTGKIVTKDDGTKGMLNIDIDTEGNQSYSITSMPEYTTEEEKAATTAFERQKELLDIGFDQDQVKIQLQGEEQRKSMREQHGLNLDTMYVQKDIDKEMVAYRNELETESQKIMAEFTNKLQTDSTLLVDKSRFRQELQKMAVAHGYSLEEIAASLKGQKELASMKMTKNAVMTQDQAIAALEDDVFKVNTDPKKMADKTLLFGHIVSQARKYPFESEEDRVKAALQIFQNNGWMDDKTFQQLQKSFGGDFKKIYPQLYQAPVDETGGEEKPKYKVERKPVNWVGPNSVSNIMKAGDYFLGDFLKTFPKAYNNVMDMIDDVLNSSVPKSTKKQPVKKGKK